MRPSGQFAFLLVVAVMLLMVPISLGDPEKPSIAKELLAQARRDMHAKRKPDATETASASRMELSEAFEDLNVDRSSREGTLYGEVTDKGGAQLFTLLNLTDQDVFCDGGSGAGRLVLQAALETSVRRAVGIEFLEERHALALVAKAKLDARGALASNKVEIEFVNADLASWPDLTRTGGCSKIFMNNVAFPKELNTALAERLLNHELVSRSSDDRMDATGPRRFLVASTYNLRLFVQDSSHALAPCKARAIPYFAEVSVQMVDTSWGGAMIYVHELCPGVPSSSRGSEL